MERGILLTFGPLASIIFAQQDFDCNEKAFAKLRRAAKELRGKFAAEGGEEEAEAAMMRPTSCRLKNGTEMTVFPRRFTNTGSKGGLKS